MSDSDEPEIRDGIFSAGIANRCPFCESTPITFEILVLPDIRSFLLRCPECRYFMNLQVVGFGYAPNINLSN